MLADDTFAEAFADFGQAGTLAGVPVRLIFDTDTEIFDGEQVVQAPSALLQPGAAVTAAEGQTVVLSRGSYKVRQVLDQPPDGFFQRLVLARVGA